MYRFRSSKSAGIYTCVSWMMTENANLFLPPPPKKKKKKKNNNNNKKTTIYSAISRMALKLIILTEIWNRWSRQRMINSHAPGMQGTFSPPPRFRNPDIHHGTCVTHVPWCMPISLNNSFIWSRWWGKRSRHSRRMHNPQFYVSGKRPMAALYRCYYAVGFSYSIGLEHCRE